MFFRKLGYSHRQDAINMMAGGICRTLQTLVGGLCEIYRVTIKEIDTFTICVVT
jgi:hypothetical protein